MTAFIVFEICSPWTIIVSWAALLLTLSNWHTYLSGWLNANVESLWVTPQMAGMTGVGRSRVRGWSSI